MKIKCEPGTSVKISETAQTSIKGGEYEVDEKYGKEAIKNKGVTEVKDSFKPADKSVDSTTGE